MTVAFTAVVFGAVFLFVMGAQHIKHSRDNLVWLVQLCFETDDSLTRFPRQGTMVSVYDMVSLYDIWPSPSEVMRMFFLRMFFMVLQEFLQHYHASKLWLDHVV